MNIRVNRIRVDCISDLDAKESFGEEIHLKAYSTSEAKPRTVVSRIDLSVQRSLFYENHKSPQ